MNARRHPFRGQIGIHETQLTTVIGYGEFKAAEQIIESTNDPTFLNDGRYENIPLHMVLTNNNYADSCRNLKLARLLVQKGASPNLRIPYGDMDGASPSPFEELVVYYEVLKAYVAGASDALCEELEMYFENEEAKLQFLTNTVDLNNAKCSPNLENCEKLIRHTSDLIDVFLQYGSDPSVLTTFAQKSLFHWVIEHEDVELAKRFLETCRVNLSLCDVHGSTPLMDTILRNSPQNSITIYEAMRDTTSNLDINTCDCCGETALFRAVFAGATELAVRLCEDGAKLRTAVCLSYTPMSVCRKHRDNVDGVVSCLFLPYDMSPMTTPFLAPMLADSPVCLRYVQVSTQDTGSKVIHPHKHLVDKIIQASVSPLIDSGCFSDPFVASEVTSLVGTTNFGCLTDGDINATDLLMLMFGQVCAGLRQLCVRAIFDHSLMVSQVADKTCPKAALDVFCSHNCAQSITNKKTKMLMEILGLPQAFQVFFDIEAAKYQTCGLVMSHCSMECDQACSVSEESIIGDSDDDDSDDSDLFSSLYADSDSLLYFSSDIHDDSSEESEDLSDEDLSGSEEEEEEEHEVEKTRETKQEATGLKKIKYEQENSASESENMRVVVEIFCEDLAEGVAQDRPNVCCDKYQRLADESTTSTESPENLTASDSISDSLC